MLLDDRPASLSFLNADDRGCAENEMTGTLPEYRGLARLAKLAVTRWAREKAIRAIYTYNDADNRPMLPVNRRLGYRPRKELVEFSRDAATGSSRS